MNSNIGQKQVSVMRAGNPYVTDQCYIIVHLDIVFANSTCFDEDLMKSMALVAEHMKPGARIITLTKQLPSSEFTLLDRRQYVMSWGEATCFMSIRQVFKYRRSGVIAPSYSYIICWQELT